MTYEDLPSSGSPVISVTAIRCNVRLILIRGWVYANFMNCWFVHIERSNFYKMQRSWGGRRKDNWVIRENLDARLLVEFEKKKNSQNRFGCQQTSNPRRTQKKWMIKIKYHSLLLSPTIGSLFYSSWNYWFSWRRTFHLWNTLAKNCFFRSRYKFNVNKYVYHKPS